MRLLALLLLALAACSAPPEPERTTLVGRERTIIIGTRRVASTATYSGLSGTASDPNTATPPAGAALTLSDIHGYTVRLSADSGETLLATGSLKCWGKWQGADRWHRVPDLDLPVPSGAAGLRDVAWGEQEGVLGAPGDEVVYIPSGLTASGGTFTVALRAVGS